MCTRTCRCILSARLQFCNTFFSRLNMPIYIIWNSLCSVYIQIISFLLIVASADEDYFINLYFQSGCSDIKNKLIAPKCRCQCYYSSQYSQRKRANEKSIFSELWNTAWEKSSKKIILRLDNVRSKSVLIINEFVEQKTILIPYENSQLSCAVISVVCIVCALFQFDLCLFYTFEIGCFNVWYFPWHCKQTVLDCSWFFLMWILQIKRFCKCAEFNGIVILFCQNDIFMSWLFVHVLVSIV